MTIYNFEELEAWKACRDLRTAFKPILLKMPKTDFDLIDNLKRALRSTTRNIAEGFGRYSFQENSQFCRISRGSLYEIWDDLISLKEDGICTVQEFEELKSKIELAIKILNGYISYLQKAKNK